MSEFVKQNAKILKSLNVNIERLSLSTIEWFVTSKSIPDGVIWTRGEQPEPEEQFGRFVSLLSISKKDNGVDYQLLFATENKFVDTVKNARRMMLFSDLQPQEKLYVSIVLINKYLK